MAQLREIDSVPQWCDAFTRINVRAHQAEPHIARQCVGAGEFPQDRDERFSRHQPSDVEVAAQREPELPLVERENRKAPCRERFAITPLRARVRWHGGTGYSRSDERRGSTRLPRGSNPDHP